MSTLFVCSVGGHLAQLHRLAPRLEGVDADRLWVTFDTPQSRSLLASEKVLYLGYTGPRDIENVLRHSLTARHLFAYSPSFSSVVSTGSGIALSFLPLARAYGARAHYIESFTRSAGPSLTGRLIARIPGVRLYSQYPGWARGRWLYRGSVFDSFQPGAPRPAPAGVRRAVVTLGTMRDYPFPAALRAALAALPPGAEVLWQTGCTATEGLPIQAHEAIAGAELSAAIAAADVVIAHAGCGSALTTLEAGKKPVLIARRASAGENVDDHQLLLAAELARRGLALARSPETLRGSDLEAAAAETVLSGDGARFTLETR